MSIKILESDIVNKIAAGEVIERPASVVKELVENSIDAGAAYITVEIQKSGKEFIAVSDNGQGMTKEDALLSVKRHSTSKITDISDLEKIRTMGFRGEALPSIASISAMEIITKTNNAKTGFLMELTGGNITNSSEIGTSVGTIIKVKNIFKNVPARLKFLKSDSTEKNKIISLITEYALANFNLSFRLISDNKELFNYPPARDLLERLAQIFGNEFINELLNIELSHEQVGFTPTPTERPLVWGFISKPEKTFLRRNRIFTFINKRPVNSRTIVNAVKNGYAEFLQQKENPAMFLFFDINPASIDVNVHPTKREIRFKDDSAIYSLVLQMVRSRIVTKEVIPAIKPRQSYPSGRSKENEFIASKPAGYAPQEFSIKKESDKKEKTGSPLTPPLRTPSPFIQGRGIGAGLKHIGRIFALYILAEDTSSENGNSLMLIDQHAAQEKILYEKLKKDIAKKTLAVQPLLVPVNLELPPKEFAILQELKENLGKIGFEVDEFGKNSFIIKSVPVAIGDTSPISIVAEIIKRKKVGELSEASGDILDNIMQTACKAAIKAGDKLSEAETAKLLDELFMCANPYTCPHGRPTIVKLTKDELDKRFLRK
ncbi:MAG: DNA mismatch repair endonuclease MutL [Elusimicrobia bacterium]|nr:DNA mismatch repair endonuclease MutL [Elusimicrobiota bacterium]